MNIDDITPLVLHVTAKENLNIQDDLTSVQTKTISELLVDQQNEEKKEDSTIIS